MVMTHVVFVLYWLVKDLRVDPAARLFRDYSSPTLVHWNCLFLPLDLEVAAYAASKAAVGALTKSLTVEWGLRGVCVNQSLRACSAQTPTPPCSAAASGVKS